MVTIVERTFVSAASRLVSTLLLAVSSLLATTPAKTFSHDVWPILKSRCVNCHQQGEVAPMAFTSYKQVRPWAGAIREAVLSGKMPPWHAAPENSHAFRNDRSLSKAEIETLVAWVDSGAEEGGSAAEYLPEARQSSWKLGQPDAV